MDYLLSKTGLLETPVVPTETQPNSILISGVDRFSAVALASSLVTHLDTGNAPRNRKQINTDFGESLKRTQQEEPIVFERMSRDLSYKIIVGESELGKYVLQARTMPSVRGEEQLRNAHQKINLGLMAVLNSIELDSITQPASEAWVDQETTDPEETIDIADIIDVPKGREVATIKDAKNIMRMLSVKDVDVRESELQTLWEKTGRDPIALFDLYMEAISEKLKFFGGDKYLEDPTSLQDLIDASNRPESEDLLDLRRKLEKKSVKNYVELGINETQIRTMFQWVGPVGSLQLRYVAWISSQPFMRTMKSDIRAVMFTKKEGEKFTSDDLFRLTTANVEEAYKDHTSNQSETYDFNYGFQSKAFNNKKDNLRALYLLGLRALYIRDISKYIQ